MSTTDCRLCGINIDVVHDCLPFVDQLRADNEALKSELTQLRRAQEQLMKVAQAANTALGALKIAYGQHYPGEMYELVKLDNALSALDTPKGGGCKCSGSATLCPRLELPFDFCRCDCHEGGG